MHTAWRKSFGASAKAGGATLAVPSFFLTLGSLVALFCTAGAAGTLAAEPADPLRPPAIQTESVPVVPRELADRLQQYQNVRSAAFRGWAPDGNGILVATRFGDTSQLHRVYVPGGRREQITFLREPVDGRFLGERTDQFLLETARGGDENYQILRLDLSAGRTTLLTDGKSRYSLGPQLEASGKTLITSNARNGRDTDVVLLDPFHPEAQSILLETNKAFWIPSDWSEDGKQVLLYRFVSSTESHPAIFDVESRKLTPLPELSQQAETYRNLQFLSGGKKALLVTTARGEFAELACLDLDDPDAHSYTFPTQELKIPADVSDLEVDRKSGRIAFAVNLGGVSEVYVAESLEAGFKPLKLPIGIVGSLEFSPDGKKLGMSLVRPDAPTDAYSVDLASGELVRWTFSEVGGLNPATFRTSTPFEYKSYDGLTIPGFIARPSVASRENKVPVLIDIHGGPEGQSRPFFSGYDQFLLQELGIAVVRPNVRGSSGYGKTYLQLDDVLKRLDSVKDIGALLDWIATQEDLDASRVAVSGGSYGGFMTLASLVHYSDRIRAGIDVVGIANFNTFLKNTSAYRQDLRRAEYGDERLGEVEEFFVKISPAHRADRIRSALMVVHGKNDPRVPFSEAEQIAKEVRSHGRHVWTVFADNEGHGFSRKENRDYLTAAMVLFLQKELLPKK